MDRQETQSPVSEVDNDTLEAAKAELRKSMEQTMEAPKDGEELEYVEPIQDPYNKAIKYLEEHNILQLFQGLTANIVYTKPGDPLDYIIDEICEMKKNNMKLPKEADKYES